MNYETETIDKLFLEISQFTQARTRRELDLENRIDGLTKDIEKLFKYAKDYKGAAIDLKLELIENLRLLCQR